MPSDDLSSIPGLEDKHLRALGRQHITGLRGLADADRQAVYRAMGNLRPRPTLAQISRWQDDARDKLEEAAAQTPDWITAASFVVVFSHRRVGDAWERHVEVERTEVEPERNPRVWPGWDCEPVCGWMLAQLNQADGAGHSAGITPEPETAGGRARAQLHIDSAVIVDASSRADVVTAGALVANPPAELVAPVRVIFTVTGAYPGTQLLAVTRIVRRDGPGWNPRDPVVVPGSGQAEFDLSGIPEGEHEMSLIAWAPDATAKPVSFRLPRLTIRLTRSL